MCIVSMVHDKMGPAFPDIQPWDGRPVYPTVPSVVTSPNVVALTAQPSFDFSELKKLIEEFRELIKAATLLDQKLNQPDCVDPEKAKLGEKIAKLESLINSPPEFVIVEGGGLQPGKYRVIDGKLYKALE